MKHHLDITIVLSVCLLSAPLIGLLCTPHRNIPIQLFNTVTHANLSRCRALIQIVVQMISQIEYVLYIVHAVYSQYSSIFDESSLSTGTVATCTCTCTSIIFLITVTYRSALAHNIGSKLTTAFYLMGLRTVILAWMRI